MSAFSLVGDNSISSEDSSPIEYTESGLNVAGASVVSKALYYEQEIYVAVKHAWFQFI